MIFQRVRDNIVEGISHVAAHLSDIILSGRNDQEYIRSKIIVWIQNAGLKLKLDKCKFMQPEMNYKRVKSRVWKWGICETSSSSINFTKIRVSLDLVNYYVKLISNRGNVLELQFVNYAKSKYETGLPFKRKFPKIKQMMQALLVLIHYDPFRPFFLAWDASPDGIGAILFQVLCRHEHTAGFVSRSLTATERNYYCTD